MSNTNNDTDKNKSNCYDDVRDFLCKYRWQIVVVLFILLVVYMWCNRKELIQTTSEMFQPDTVILSTPYELRQINLGEDQLGGAERLISMF